MTKIRHYNHTINYQKQRRTKRRVIKVVVVLLVLVGLAALGLWLDSKRLAHRQTPQQTKAITTEYKPEVNTFKTKYFEMVTPTGWEFDEKQSTANHFVYHNVRHKLVHGNITVYVNEAPKTQHRLASRLLPVKIDADGILQPQTITDHCNKTAPSKDKVGEESIKLKNVTFLCDNDATWYSVLLGIEGGSTEIPYKHPDGTTNKYVIYYQDSGSEPDPNSLMEVIRKFKLL